MRSCWPAQPSSIASGLYILYRETRRGHDRILTARDEGLISVMIPKAEIHAHLEGTVGPDLVRRLATRNDMDPCRTGCTTPMDGSFAWTDFLDFLRAYDAASSVIRTPQDYRDVTYEYLLGCAA